MSPSRSVALRRQQRLPGLRPRTCYTGRAMAKQLVVKMRGENELRKMTVTDWKIENGKLRAFDGDKQVGDFPEWEIASWNVEDVEKF